MLHLSWPCVRRGEEPGTIASKTGLSWIQPWPNARHNHEKWPHLRNQSARGGENQLGVAGLGKEPTDIRERGDQCLAGHRDIDVPRRLAALRGDARRSIPFDESNQPPVTRVVDAAPTRPVAH